jgi:hypothetical protein
MTSHLTLKFIIIITRNDAIKLIFVKLFSVSQNTHCDTEVEKIIFPLIFLADLRPQHYGTWFCKFVPNSKHPKNFSKVMSIRNYSEDSNF